MDALFITHLIINAYYFYTGILDVKPDVETVIVYTCAVSVI